MTQENKIESTYTATRVTVASTKPFEKTVKDLLAELGRASTETLDMKITASKNFEELATELDPVIGRSGLINVATLNWGRMMSRVPVEMKAMHFALGNPLTAKKLLEAGGAEAGLYLPTRIFIYVDPQGVTQIAYDKLTPAFASRNKPELTALTEKIDGVLEKLASSAAL